MSNSLKELRKDRVNNLLNAGYEALEESSKVHELLMNKRATPDEARAFSSGFNSKVKLMNSTLGIEKFALIIDK